MKCHCLKYVTFVLLVAVVASIPRVNAGELYPAPGPVQPTNRVQLNDQFITLPYTIAASGSYVLTSNLTGVSGQSGIVIDADNVTLDLNGFTLMGASGSLDGIIILPTHYNISVFNGTIRNWGGHGVNGDGSHTSSFRNLRVSDNGLRGLFVESGTTIENCIAVGNGDNGISAGHSCTITRCTSRNNGGNGINAGGYGSITIGCASGFNDGSGFRVPDGSTILNCTATNNDEHGILVDGKSRVVGNNCHDNGKGGDGAGIYVSTNGNGAHIEANSTTQNDHGIDVDGAGNVIVKNVARANGTDYDIAAGNAHGPIINVAGLGDMSVVPGADHPWANFEF